MIRRFQERQADCPTQFSEWKGKLIEDFQADLEEKVKGRISTRWFYDHLKTDRGDRMPRIDILNLLSAYCGYASWEAFKAEHSPTVEVEQEPVVIQKEALTPPQRTSGYLKKGLVLLSILIVASVLIALTMGSKTNYSICFVDADFGMPIVNKNLAVMLPEEGDSGTWIKADSNGCVQLTLDKTEFEIIVQADYYAKGTFKIKVGEKTGQEIALKVDDYSLLIHQLSMSSNDDWERRRSQLEGMIHEDAVIILVAQDNQGIEMYNREEFIDRMTMPISALKNIRILQTEYRDEKISKMRITQEGEHE